MMTPEHYDDKTLAEVLAEAMKLKGITLAKLADATGVTERNLELLLAERFDELPSAPYVHGYLVKIAEVLGLDGQALWDAYGRYHREIRRAGHRDALPKNRFDLPKISRRVVLGASAIAIILGFVASRFLMGGTTFSFEVNIPENLIVATSTYRITGKIRAGDELLMNGAAVPVAPEGTFTQTVNLSPGPNTITFTVRRPLEGEREFEKLIFFAEPEATAE